MHWRKLGEQSFFVDTPRSIPPARDIMAAGELKTSMTPPESASESYLCKSALVKVGTGSGENKTGEETGRWG